MAKQYNDPEIWLPLAGYNGVYEISNHGKVWVNDCVRHMSNGRTRKFGGKFLSANPAEARKNAYPLVALFHPVTQERRIAGIHVLVAETFLGPKPSPVHEVNHKDLDKRNFHHSNLEWVTHKRNCVHAWEEGARDAQCRFLVFKGQKKTVTQWGRILNIKPGLIFGRISSGMPVSEALETNERKRKQIWAKRLSVAKRKAAPKYKDGLSAIEWAAQLGISRASFLWRIVNYPNNNAIIYRKGTFPKGCTTADIIVRQEGSGP